MLIVATPIGNLGDITLRGLDALASADQVLCEDTRVTGGLLHKYGISKPLLSYHDHNAAAREVEILGKIEAGARLALVSDAGTPLISDPGFQLVRACRARGLTVTVVPGASALLTALAGAGLPTDRFMFVGFLPPKQAARRKSLAEVAGIKATLVFYESPARLQAALADMAESLGGGRQACVARELTKLYEESRSGTLDELAAHYKEADDPKGEIVIVVEPPSEEVAALSDEELDARLAEALSHMSLKDAAALIAAQTGLRKAEVYRRGVRVLEGKG